MKTLKSIRNAIVRFNLIWSAILFCLMLWGIFRVSNNGHWDTSMTFDFYQQTKGPSIFGNQFIGYLYTEYFDCNDLPDDTTDLGAAWHDSAQGNGWILLMFAIYFVFLFFTMRTKSEISGLIFGIIVSVLSISFICFLIVNFDYITKHTNLY